MNLAALDEQAEPTGPTGLAFDLPAGWCCFDLREPALDDRVDDLLSELPGGVVADPPGGEPGIRDVIARLVSDGADCLVLRPAVDGSDVAIAGGVFVSAPLRVSGAHLYHLLDERGEAVALGDLDGLPIVSLVRPVAAAAASALVSLQVVYLICGDRATILLSFAAADRFDPRRVVGEVARVVSGARVVR
jgi:hypothetical protein